MINCAIFDNFQLFELFEVIVRKYKGILDDYVRLSGFEGQQAKTSSLFAYAYS